MQRFSSGQSLAGLFGLGFVVLGVLGFIPGIVHDYGGLHWCGTGSTAELFGVFATSIVGNLLYIGFGVAGLVCGRSAAAARGYLTIGGAALIGFGVYGLVIDRLGDANVVPVDRASSWLHVGVGVAMTWAGTTASLARPRPQPA